MFSFPESSITIVRKKGDEYVLESINTEPILQGSRLSADANRKNVIARLRQDPSVFLVMEPKDGRCEEEATHPSGFQFNVIVEEGESPRSSLRVTYKEALAYEESFPEEGEEFDEDFDPESLVLNTVTVLLENIEEGYYDFVMDSCPYFVKREPAEPVSTLEASHILEKEGYQVERLTTIGNACKPVLFVSENDIVLLGSYHFDGEDLFLEMKRRYYLASDSEIEATIRYAQKSNYLVTTIHWEDGTWSFRTALEGVDSENFLDLMNEGVSLLRTFINLVESAPQAESVSWGITQPCSHFFIYETMAESIKMDKLKI